MKLLNAIEKIGSIGPIATLSMLFGPPAAYAGMPSPLPTHVEKLLVLNDNALERLQAISFFLLGFLLSAAALRFLWNYLQRDFPALPRLTYGKALAAVFLWGLLFVIVLTMISGARELMTPGAWTKQGFTYKLTDEAKQSTEAVRRQQLEKLRTALLQFAATHQGRFPIAAEVTAIPSALWEIPESGGMRYLYVPGRSAGHLPEILAYETELDSDQRLVLQTNGDIMIMRTAEIQAAVPQGNRP
jgi:hypothetical protein